MVLISSVSSMCPPFPVFHRPQTSLVRIDGLMFKIEEYILMICAGLFLFIYMWRFTENNIWIKGAVTSCAVIQTRARSASTFIFQRTWCHQRKSHKWPYMYMFVYVLLHPKIRPKYNKSHSVWKLHPPTITATFAFEVAWNCKQNSLNSNINTQSITHVH